jgi:hypothetical protein
VKEVTAVVRVITVAAAEKMEGAVRGMGTAEAKTAVPAWVMGIAAVIGAAETPEEVEDEVAGTVAVAVRATAEMPAVVARGMGGPKVASAVVVGAPEVAAKAVGALELAVIRAPGTVAAPAKSMEAEAALAPKAPGALKARAIRPATVAENLGERRLRHPRP